MINILTVAIGYVIGVLVLRGFDDLTCAFRCRHQSAEDIF